MSPCGLCAVIRQLALTRISQIEQEVFLPNGKSEILETPRLAVQEGAAQPAGVHPTIGMKPPADASVPATNMLLLGIGSRRGGGLILVRRRCRGSGVGTALRRRRSGGSGGGVGSLVGLLVMMLRLGCRVGCLRSLALRRLIRRVRCGGALSLGGRRVLRRGRSLRSTLSYYRQRKYKHEKARQHDYSVFPGRGH
jgi:hypothetical protein